MKIQRPSSAQSGVTLIELMIAITISMLILLAITQLYLSSYSTQKSQEDSIRLNESARFSFDLISRELRKAGFRNNWETGSASPVFCSAQAVSEFNAGPSMLGKNDAATIDPATADFSGGTQITVLNSSDVLRVRYFGEGTTGTSDVADCHGYPVARDTLVEDTLFVAADPNNGNEPALWCNTSNTTRAGVTTNRGKLALVSGVESMQFLYGEDTDADGIVNQYLPWRTGSTVADNILGVKASVVVRAPNNGNVVANSTFQHFAASYPSVANSDSGAIFTAPSDSRLRKLFSTESATRNFRYCDALN
jgi:type IV pilus assembly protein PilW